MRRLAPPLALAVSCWLAGAFTGAQDSGREAAWWPQFRGHNALGVSIEQKKLPIEFGPEKNVLWKTPLSPGYSSPCIWDQRIFLTAYDKATEKLETLCLDRTDGRILWRRTVPAEAIEKTHRVSSPAAATPATDGRRVYVYFGSYGLLCYDFDGNELWKKPLPLAEARNGTGTSPVVAGEWLLLSCEFQPDPSLLAVDCRTGATVWKQVRKLISVAGPVDEAYATPVVWRHDGVEEVIIHSPARLTAHDLKDGRERWSLPITSGAATTPVLGDGLLYLTATWIGTDPGESDQLPTFDELLKRAGKDGDGPISRMDIPDDLHLMRRPESTNLPGTQLKLRFLFAEIDTDKNGQISRAEWDQFLADDREFSRKLENGLLAIATDDKGDVNGARVLWREKRALPEVSSPLYYRDRVYMFKDGGIVSCLEAKTGQLLYRGRIGAGGPYFASPVAGDGKVYAASLNGDIVVLAVGDKLEILARNKLGESIGATPALVDGKIYVRTENHIYAFGE